MKKANILIVEDEAIVAIDTQETLKSAGYNAEITCSGEKALEFAKANKPDIILMDIKLRGGMDGIEAARRISEIYNPPIIYMTAYMWGNMKKRIGATNPLYCLSKPINESELLHMIDIASKKAEHSIDDKVNE